MASNRDYYQEEDRNERRQERDGRQRQGGQRGRYQHPSDNSRDDRRYHQDGQYQGYGGGGGNQGYYGRQFDERSVGYFGRGGGGGGGYQPYSSSWDYGGGQGFYEGHQPSSWRWQDNQTPRGRGGKGRGRGGGRGRGRGNNKGQGQTSYRQPQDQTEADFSQRDNPREGYDDRSSSRYPDGDESYRGSGKRGGRGGGGGGKQGRGGRARREQGQYAAGNAYNEEGAGDLNEGRNDSKARQRSTPQDRNRDTSGQSFSDRSNQGDYDGGRRGDRWLGERDFDRGNGYKGKKGSQNSGKGTADDGRDARNRSNSGSGKDRGPMTNHQQQKGSRRPQPRKATRLGNTNQSQTGSLIEQLTSGSYECLVCCDRIKCEARVWSCKTCYVVFHLGCIKKWAKSPAASAEGTDGWQCPACRGVEIKIPHVYFCFCGKLREPPWEPGETPHSCGEVCRKKRPTSCPHTCNILCHPGPCPPCPSNVQTTCLCGKSQQTVRCGSQKEIRCQEACGKQLNCGVHTCDELCHAGQCQPCEEVVTQECYCGQATREVNCDRETASHKMGGSYSCTTPCSKSLDCGQHKCDDPCHPGACPPCRLDPAHITHCPCGATPIDSLGGPKRTQCIDPVPTCTNKCHKVFPCGGKDTHRCEQTCHTGPCPPCKENSNVKCRCGHRFVDVPCEKIAAAVRTEQGMPEVTCDRKCTKKKTCGRHKCGQQCCVDQEHLCFQQCGRKLKCGIHGCEEPCHVGNCPPCLHASFDELTCHCGTEVLFPPIPCGTPPPECRQPCNRRHDCEHPTSHHCHSEERCPPCVVLMSKTCIGGHEVRYNIPCHVQRISCGRPCGKPLPCGYHTCLKTCHDGDCDPECKQPCKVPRPDCGHQCNVTCHVGWPCPQITCKTRVTVKCPCRRRSQVMECQASGADISAAMQRLTVSKLAGKIQTLQRNEEVDISELTGAKGAINTNRLLCDEECSLQERNRRLAVALQIKNPEMMSGSKNTTPYSDFLKEQAKKHPGFVAAIEKELAALVVSAQSSKQPSRSHAFPSMIKTHRRIIHELAEFYGCESESYDEEPKRNVVSTARKNRCYMPSMTLTATIQRGLNPRAPLPIPHTSQEDEIRSAAKAVKLSTDVVSLGKPKEKIKVIDYFDMGD